MTPFATTLTPWQVAQLWADLEDAYEGRCSYGSDTFECYAYRVLPNDPTFNAAMIGGISDAGDGIYATALRDNAKMARDALVSVARAFEERRECIVLINEARPDRFATWAGFTHRVQVQVKKTP